MMQCVSLGAAARRKSICLDFIIAAALALVLTAGWAMSDWSRLSQRLLPDHDDMMRLAQVRDWLAGQGLNDWTQYRMAAPDGAPMHWSRINDLGIAALILLGAPLVGRPDAELMAVIAYPAILFAIALYLSARIGRRLWGPAAGPVAAVLTALAYPGTTVFLPGRIDHHALQVVLIQLIVLVMMRAPGWGVGIAAGAATAASLVVGLETVPQVAALIAATALQWVIRGDDERTRLAGFAAGLGGATLSFLAFLRPTYWSPQLCDAFTPASSMAALAVAAALAMLAAATGQLPQWRARIVAGALLGAAVVGGVLIAFPACIEGPYGAMDPFLRAAFIPSIDEANGVFAQPRIARIMAIGGVLTAACGAAIWMLLRERKRWLVHLPIVSVVVISTAIMLFQVRGVYVGAPLGAPVLAGLVLAARRRGSGQVPAVIAAWIGSAGLAYHTIPAQVEQLFAAKGNAESNGSKTHVLCSAGDAWLQVGRYPAGVAMTGTRVAAYLIGATHHSTVGAGYHRNDTGNMAMYRFFLSPPEQSREIGREWKTDYVVFCPGDFGEIDVTRRYPNSLAARLQRGDVPAWLEPLPLDKTPLRLFRVR